MLSDRNYAQRILFASITLGLSALLAGGCGKGPSKEGTALAQANQYLLDQDYDSALESVDAALVAMPDDYQAHLLRGQVNFRKGDLDAAIADFTRAKEIQPTTADAYQFRYQVYLEKSKEHQISSQEWITWSDKASADQKEFYRLDTTSVAAHKGSTANFDRSDKLIERTNEAVAELDALQTEEMETKLLVQPNFEEEAGDESESAEGEANLATNQTDDPYKGLVRETKTQEESDDSTDSQSGDKNRSPMGIDWLADKEDERTIREQDLASNEQADDDAPLQHGDDPDPDPEQSEEVLPQITRNDLGAYLPLVTPNNISFPPSLPPALPTTGLNGNKAVANSAPNAPMNQGYGQFASGTTGIVSNPTRPGQGPSLQTQTQAMRTTGFNATSQPGSLFPGPPNQVAPPWAGSPTVTNSNPTLNRPGLPNGQSGLGNSSGSGPRISSALPGTGAGYNGQPASQFGQQAGFGLPNNSQFNGPAGYLSGNTASRQGAAQDSRPNGSEENQSRLPAPKKLTEAKPATSALQGTESLIFGGHLPQMNPYYRNLNEIPAAKQPPAALLPEVQSRIQ